MYFIPAIVCMSLAIAPMVQCAKGLAQNPRDPTAVSQWRGANHQVIFKLLSSCNFSLNKNLTFLTKSCPFSNINCFHIGELCCMRPK